MSSINEYSEYSVCRTNTKLSNKVDNKIMRNKVFCIIITKVNFIKSFTFDMYCTKISKLLKNHNTADHYFLYHS